MSRAKLSQPEIEAWVSGHAGWSVGEQALRKRFSFPDYPATIAFVTRLAFAAEKKDHHPDLLVSWGKVEVSWSTHDAGGITALDLTMAEQTDKLAG
jgi:4a-hydroxytetrahydrobiopterin dehydratase